MTKEKLWEQITRKRKEMGEAYAAEGSTERVIALSRELDRLLELYDELLRNEKKS